MGFKILSYSLTSVALLPIPRPEEVRRPESFFLPNVMYISRDKKYCVSEFCLLDVVLHRVYRRSEFDNWVSGQLLYPEYEAFRFFFLNLVIKQLPKFYDSCLSCVFPLIFLFFRQIMRNCFGSVIKAFGVEIKEL